MNEVRSQVERALADRYRLERELGRGGMAVVYLARDLRHDRDVAIKVLRRQLAAVLGAERFLREIRIAARLDHPHILTVIDSGDADGVPYYVLPYIRGESLRERLQREHELPIDDAVTIACQVAGALDHAHRHGVIHRDIKPENILLHEGEAMLADFGIALAVREAGGTRLTESGISLGTPQYMSPEQATADRELDARSDVYSLATVTYEMLAGEPPITGPTAQAVIARLLTQKPVRLRSRRDTVPEHIDAAVAKALATVPADRFRSAAAFARAISRGRAGGVAFTGGRRRWWPWLLGVLGALVAAAGAWFVLGRSPPPPPPSAAYADRQQITFTGDAMDPALSRDGSRLAYVVRDCTTGTCRYGIEVRDLAGGGARLLLDSAYTIGTMQWSADERFLLVAARLGAHFGMYLVPVLGGQPRMIASGFATFFPRTDSMLVTSASAPAGARQWIRIMTPDGARHDSIPLRGLRGQIMGAFMTPGRRWIALGVETNAGVQALMLNRRGVVSDRKNLGQNTEVMIEPPRIAGGATWEVTSFSGAGRGPLVRTPLDLAHGRFLRRADTVLDVAEGGFDVAEGGNEVAYVEGSDRWSLWVLGIDSALAGRFEPADRRLTSTSLLAGVCSPDGKRLLVLRVESSGPLLSVHSLAGDSLATIRAGPGLISASWTPEGSVEFASVDSTGAHLVLADPATGAVVRSVAIPDSGVAAFAALPDSGWAWVPLSGMTVRVMRRHDAVPRDYAAPPGVRMLLGLQASLHRHTLTAEGADSSGALVVYALSIPGGRITTLARLNGPAFEASGDRLADGSLLVDVWRGRGLVALYRLTGAPGRQWRVHALGTIPRRVPFVESTPNGRTLAVTTRQFQGDIWIARRTGSRD